MNVGTNAALIAPSANRSRTRFGILNATLKASIALPAPNIDAAVAEAIAETGAASVKDMGKVMKAVMPKLAGKNADGKAVNEAVRRSLGA